MIAGKVRLVIDNNIDTGCIDYLTSFIFMLFPVSSDTGL